MSNLVTLAKQNISVVQKKIREKNEEGSHKKEVKANKRNESPSFADKKDKSLGGKLKKLPGDIVNKANNMVNKIKK